MSYTATFTLTQDDDGMVTPSLVFNPLVDPTKDEAPDIYGYMADVALRFLQLSQLVDEDGQWISQETADGVELTLSSPSAPAGVSKH